MPYEVLARRWRPQQFSDVVGQDHVTETLGNAISTDRIAHAYLFVGPRGIGKTSVARIFAKALNCEKGPTAEPCGECDACREITDGRSLDVLEIDGASNNGVEQVRELRDTVIYAPARGKFKIYIIDEVHMLSVAAFNALLKTLEEPPAHVKFFFATTEPQKVLPTIISRCQRFDLRRIPASLITERLRLIADEEQIRIDEDALLAIARGAEGGLRDAESALDQLISFKGDGISEEDVLAIFGLTSRSTLDSLADAVLRGDIPELIRSMAELDSAGKDLQRLVAELMEHFRNLLICLHVEDDTGREDLTPGQLEVLREQAGRTDTERLLRIVDILTQAGERMRFSLCRRTLMEAALIRAARASVTVSLEEIIDRIDALRQGGAAPSPSRRPGVAGEQRPEHGGVRPKPAAVAPVPASRPASADLALLREQWSAVVGRVGKVVVLAKAALAGARPVRVDGESATVRFDAEFEEDMKKLESPKVRKALERVLKEVLRRPVKAVFEVGNLSEGVPGETDEKGGSGSGKAPKPAASKEGERTGQADPSPAGGETEKPSRTLREWADEPAVRKTLETFSGRILDVKE
jgi:DNA polymerase-3 subunit gamma/tau